MKNKGFTLIEVMVVMAIIGILACISIPAIMNQRPQSMEEFHKAQVISTDEKGNELWRVYDNGRFVYYMPNGETSWDGGGKGSNPMGVK